MTSLNIYNTHSSHGWFVLDKPLGMTSAKAVAIVKRLSGGAKIGHTGTLDPLATGILPLAIGEATKLTRFLFDATKAYIFSVKWGSATDTDDMEGQVISAGGHVPSLEDVMGILSQFTGDVQQVPPVYSAMKVGGKRAYALARSGVSVDLNARTVSIYALTVLNHDVSGGITQFNVVCGKGTYVRSLARDMALALSTYGHVVELRRTKVGKFTINDAISLESLEEMVYKQPFSGFLLPLEEVLDDIPVLSCSPQEKALLIVGQKITRLCDLPDGDVVPLFSEGRLFALGQIDGDSIKPARILNI